MINIVKSNRMEILLEELVRLTASPVTDPILPEWIGVQSRGMKQWLSLGICEKSGISANILFAYPRQMIQKILDASPVSLSPYIEPGKMLWSAMSFLERISIQEECSYDLLFDYIKNDTNYKKRIQLAFHITQILDNYQIWRPDMLMDWEKGNFHYKGEAGKQEIWQADVWKNMVHEHAHSTGAVYDFIQQVDQGKVRIPTQRLSLFGISTLPPTFLDFFDALSRHIPVYLFLLSPSNQFFMDMVSQKQASQIRLHSDKQDNFFSNPSYINEGYYETGNDLLTSLGRSGQQFHDSLENYEYTENYEDLFYDPLKSKINMEQKNKIKAPSMLTRIQSDILKAVKAQKGNHVKSKVPCDDKSISIHSCHSPLREVQVIKDLLLDAFDSDPELFPHEVIVMMPDIESYAPIISSVFAVPPGKGEPHIPFCISDRRRRIESKTLNAFFHLMNVKNTRLEREQVLELLTFDSIAKKFEISFQDIDIIADAIMKARIFWGRDKKHRKELINSEIHENTWIFGLDRLFMGYALDQEIMVGSTLALPFFEGTQREELGKFAHFCHCLFDSMALLEGSYSIEIWADRIRQVIMSMMDQNPGTQEEINLIFSTIDNIIQDAKTSCYLYKIEFQALLEIIKRSLDTPLSQGRFATGSLTFCNLMPMRSIPFKLVILMGMNEKSFPRQSISCSFDLMEQFPRKGDKNLRDEDRYLFLETILSARERLIISYTGKSIRDNTPLPCSGVVSELMDVIDQTFEFTEESQYLFSHFLHGFHLEYFIDKSSFFSFSPGMYRIAKAQHLAKQETYSDFHINADDAPIKESSFITSDIKIFKLKNFINFFINPAKYYMEQILNIQIARIQEPEEARESFLVKGLDKYLMTEKFIKMDQVASKEGLEIFFRASGQLPPATQGKMQLGKIQNQIRPLIELAKKNYPGSPMASPIQVSIDTYPWRLIGSIDNLYQQEKTIIRWIVTSGRLTPKRLLTQWINHLVLSTHIFKIRNTDSSFENVLTKMIAQSPYPGKPPVLYEFNTLEENPEILLKSLIEIFSMGQNEIIPFFPESCFALIGALAEKRFVLEDDTLGFALEKTRRTWLQPFTGLGEKTDPYISRLVGNSNPFESVESLKDSGIIEIAKLVYQPLLRHLS